MNLTSKLKLFYNISLFFFAFFHFSCSNCDLIYYEIPSEWRSNSELSKIKDEMKKTLKGKKIFIDPGHGGEDRNNISPRGLVVEADVNLRIALNLKKFLEEIEATPILSREKDETVTLQKRVDLANSSGAEIFISIHHDAVNDPFDRWTNYTATYYRGPDTIYEHEPSSKDLARYIQRDLSYAMRNSGGFDSFDGTYPDVYRVPTLGIFILRYLKMPAVLIECSFHTNAMEEKRLAIPEFNKIQAWGILKGIYRYYKDGFPQIIPLYNNSPNKISASDTLQFYIKDKNRIDKNSIKVFLNKKISYFEYEEAKSIVKIPLNRIKNLMQNALEIRIIAKNNFGNSSHPFNIKLKLD